MKLKAVTFAVVGCTWLAAMQSVASPRVFAEGRVQEAQTDDAGAALLSRMCSRCHDAARIVEKRRIRSNWQDVLLQMMEKGAEGSEKEFETLFTYLVVTYGEIYINQAPADEMVAVLGVTPAEADVLVKYRSANGNFANFEAVLKVPGVSSSTLEKRKAAFLF